MRAPAGRLGPARARSVVAAGRVTRGPDVLGTHRLWLTAWWCGRLVRGPRCAPARGTRGRCRDASHGCGAVTAAIGRAKSACCAQAAWPGYPIRASAG